jgi:hypothetical protein
MSRIPDRFDFACELRPTCKLLLVEDLGEFDGLPIRSGALPIDRAQFPVVRNGDAAGADLLVAFF